MRKINWGVLGTAGIAKGQTIPGMCEAENCHLYAIAGRNMEKAEAFRKEFGFEKAPSSAPNISSALVLSRVMWPSFSFPSGVGRKDANSSVYVK